MLCPNFSRVTGVGKVSNFFDPSIVTYIYARTMVDVMACLRFTTPEDISWKKQKLLVGIKYLNCHIRQPRRIPYLLVVLF